MNLVQNIQERLEENKRSVKTYENYKTACKTGDDLGQVFAKRHSIAEPVSYIPVFLPDLNRWTVVFQQMQWLQKYNTGGYIGWFASNGFFSI